MISNTVLGGKLRGKILNTKNKERKHVYEGRHEWGAVHKKQTKWKTQNETIEKSFSCQLSYGLNT